MLNKSSNLCKSMIQIEYIILIFSDNLKIELKVYFLIFSVPRFQKYYKILNLENNYILTLLLKMKQLFFSIYSLLIIILFVKMKILYSIDYFYNYVHKLYENIFQQFINKNTIIML